MSYTYSLATNPGGKFAINSTTGVVTTAGDLTGLGGTTQNIVVRATDGAGWFKDTTFGIQVTTSGFPELLDNGDFSAPAVASPNYSTGWVLATSGVNGAASIGGGVLTLSGEPTTPHYGQADQSIVTEAGKTYQLTWTHTGSNLRVFVGTTFNGGTLLTDPTVPPGSITKTFTATTSTSFIRFLCTQATPAVIDNASCQQT